MSPERTIWYDTPQTVSMTPREMTALLNQGVKRISDDPNNSSIPEFIEIVGPVASDIFTGELVRSVMKGCPP